MRTAAENAGELGITIYEEDHLLGRMIERNRVVGAAISAGESFIEIGIFPDRRDAASAILALRRSP